MVGQSYQARPWLQAAAQGRHRELVCQWEDELRRAIQIRESHVDPLIFNGFSFAVSVFVSMHRQRVANGAQVEPVSIE